MTRIGRLAAAAVLAAGLAVAAPASPAAAAACPAPDSGVTVIVDFAGLGGGIQLRCAPGDPATGLAALQAAGFDLTFVAVQPGFVCRIDGRPGDDPCQRVPPLTEYWSYWHADRGGSWTYSSFGAGLRNPGPGEVEGWAFGAGRQPGVPPPAPPPPAAPPAPEEDDPPAPGAGDPAPGQGEPPAGQQQPEPATPERAGSPTRAGPTRAVTATGTPAAPSPAAGGRLVSPSAPGAGTAAPPEPAASGTTGSGGPAGAAVTAALVCALAGAGLWTARRRRQAAGRGAGPS